jgi:hypothetical protein
MNQPFVSPQWFGPVFGPELCISPLAPVNRAEIGLPELDASRGIRFHKKKIAGKNETQRQFMHFFAQNRSFAGT